MPRPRLADPKYTTSGVEDVCSVAMPYSRRAAHSTESRVGRLPKRYPVPAARSTAAPRLGRAPSAVRATRPRSLFCSHAEPDASAIRPEAGLARPRVTPPTRWGPPGGVMARRLPWTRGSALMTTVEARLSRFPIVSDLDRPAPKEESDGEAST